MNYLSSAETNLFTALVLTGVSGCLQQIQQRGVSAVCAEVHVHGGRHRLQGRPWALVALWSLFRGYCTSQLKWSILLSKTIKVDLIFVHGDGYSLVLGRRSVRRNPECLSPLWWTKWAVWPWPAAGPSCPSWWGSQKSTCWDWADLWPSQVSTQG